MNKPIRKTADRLLTLITAERGGLFLESTRHGEFYRGYDAFGSFPIFVAEELVTAGALHEPRAHEPLGQVAITEYGRELLTKWNKV